MRRSALSRSASNCSLLRSAGVAAPGMSAARGQQLAEIAGTGDRDQLLLGLWQRHAGHRRAIDAFFLRAQVLTRQAGNWTAGLTRRKPLVFGCRARRWPATAI
jgi:hypothetical protein